MRHLLDSVPELAAAAGVEAFDFYLQREDDPAKAAEKAVSAGWLFAHAFLAAAPEHMLEPKLEFDLDRVQAMSVAPPAPKPPAKKPRKPRKPQTKKPPVSS